MRVAGRTCHALLTCAALSCASARAAAPDPREADNVTIMAVPGPPSGPAASTPPPRSVASSAQEPRSALPSPSSDAKDPLDGKFTLADATATLAGTGSLVATIRTSMGQIRCQLFDAKAPTTVANFVGLARGVRPWRSAPDGRWLTQPSYDGTTFRRVVQGFMILGGDRAGNGAGGPGYVIPDEIWPGATHDHAGQLCMSNRGPNTNGAEFFITDASVPVLDSSYTIFGECAPLSVIRAIASVPSRSERPITKVKIETIEITRDAVSASPTRPAPQPGCHDCSSGDPLSPTY